MKLQVVTNLFPLPWDPNRATFNRQQFEALANKCEVRIIVIVSWLDRIKNQLRIRPSEFGRMRLEYLWYFYIPKVLRFTYSATLLISLFCKIPGLLKYRPDCLLLSWAYPDAVAGVVIARILKIPAVIKVHGSDINMHTLHRSRSAQIAWAMAKADAVISVSEALADRLVEIGVSKDKINVIYNGVNQSLFQPADTNKVRKALNLDQAREIILYIGNLKQEKGCMDLLSAFEEVAAQNDNVDLYFIGKGPLSEPMRNRISDTGLHQRVKLLGAMGHLDLVQWINASSMIALPSHNEGVPNVLLESMACGVPVVATRVGGIPEIVSQKSGILVKLGDKKELQCALTEALHRNWNKQAIVNSVKGFTWENNAQQVYNLLGSITGR